MVRQNDENIQRFWGWWRVSTRSTGLLWFICIFSITVFSTLAYSTVFGKSIAGSATLGFIKAEGEC